MNSKSNWKQKSSLARKQVLIALNHGLASPIESGPMIKLFEKIHSDCENELNSLRKAQDYFDGGYRTQLENLGAIEPGSRERDFGCGFRLHSPSGSVDQELNETEKALVYCASRHDSPDKPI